MTNTDATKMQYDLLLEAFQKPIVTLGVAAKYLGMSKNTLLGDATLPKKHIGTMTCVSLVSLAYWLTTRS